MKKFILIVAASGTFVMCKKGETTQAQLENSINNIDSIAVKADKNINMINDEAEAVFDSAGIKIQDFEKSKNKAAKTIESTSKSIDSLSEKIAGMKLESKPEKKDSAYKNPGKIVVNVPAPKVIKETKIVYKDRPKNKKEEL